MTTLERLNNYEESWHITMWGVRNYNRALKVLKAQSNLMYDVNQSIEFLSRKEYKKFEICVHFQKEDQNKEFIKQTLMQWRG